MKWPTGVYVTVSSCNDMSKMLKNKILSRETENSASRRPSYLPCLLEKTPLCFVGWGLVSNNRKEQQQVTLQFYTRSVKIPTNRFQNPTAPLSKIQLLATVQAGLDGRLWTVSGGCRKYQLGRTWLSLDGALGQPYGSCFDAGAGGHVAKVAMDEDGDTELSKDFLCFLLVSPVWSSWGQFSLENPFSPFGRQFLVEN